MVIVTLHVPGTFVKKSGESLEVTIPVPPHLRLENRGKYKPPEQEATGDPENQEGGEKSVDNEGGTKKKKKEPIAWPRNTTKIGIKTITCVVVTSRVGITVPILTGLARHSIPVIFIDKHKPVAVMNPFAAHGTVLVRKAQFKAIDGPKGFEIAKQLVSGGLENKARLLLLLGKNRKGTDPALATRLRGAAMAIRGIGRRVSGLEYPATSRAGLMGHEGDGARIYFDAIGRVVPARFKFKGRNRRPPRDPVNAMLGLGYALLQGNVTVALSTVGIEPYAGFLHADRSGKPSMVLDFMEMYRQPIVDRLVLAMANLGEVSPEMFDLTPTGVRFKDHAIGAFFDKALSRMGPRSPEELERATGQNYYREFIGRARDLSRFLTGKAPSFEPYLMDW